MKGWKTMETKTTAYVDISDTIVFTADYSDFDHDHYNWQQSYFQLLAWKNTWGIPIYMDMLSRSDGDPFVEIIIKAPTPIMCSEYKDHDIVDMMVRLFTSYGYKSNHYKQRAGFVELDNYSDKAPKALDCVYDYYMA